MRKLFLLILLAVCLQTHPISAQNQEFRNAIHAKLNFFDFGVLNDDDFRLSEGFEVGYFRNVGPYLNVGIPFKLGLAKLPGVDENKVSTSLDLVFHLGNMRNDAKISPYAFGGAGYFLEDFSNGHLQFPFGAGANFRISKFAFINVQGEYRKATEDLRDNIQIGAGFVYLLHKSDPKPVLPPDKDNDGTADALDKCPDSPGPASALGCPDSDGDGLGDAEDDCPRDPGPLDTKGCPDYDKDGFPDKDDECPTEAGRWNGCPDTDFDGVPDKNDQCPTEAGTAANNGCPDVSDSDGDGVPDKDDKCPTLAGTNDGCPDSDGDGVADNLDKCPKVPGAPQNNGCPVEKDSDGDGVADNIDKCPNTPGTNFGCPEVKQEVKERLAFATKAVQFETGRATLKNHSFAILDEIVEIMRQYPDYTLSISGHTDDIGDERDNLRLSESRAKTCYDYFMFRGIKANRLRFAGFGENRPIAGNDTKDGREQNRRVEFELILD
ncbi:MAG: thrombospondin type 3 repeat-containing protein [Lewinellaceae bacterium]|nr:thrombospondin type 3 repeat-containing protein [Lewinellaceae bacterium]